MFVDFLNIPFRKGWPTFLVFKYPFRRGVADVCRFLKHPSQKGAANVCGFFKYPFQKGATDICRFFKYPLLTPSMYQSANISYCHVFYSIPDEFSQLFLRWVHINVFCLPMPPDL